MAVPNRTTVEMWGGRGAVGGGTVRERGGWGERREELRLTRRRWRSGGHRREDRDRNGRRLGNKRTNANINRERKRR